LLRACLDEAIAAGEVELERRGGKVKAAPLQTVRDLFFGKFEIRKKGGKDPAPEQAEETKRRAWNRVLSNPNTGVGMRTTAGVAYLWREPSKASGK
jgi:hypothetical protein